MPRINETILQCSIYLYPSKEIAKTGKGGGGSGFLVGIPTVENSPASAPTSDFLYAVSNSHVVLGGNSVIRLNTMDGGTDYIETNPNLWTHSDVADICVYQIEISELRHQHLFFPTNIFVNKNHLVINAIGPGDDTFVVGRFINHEGAQQNRPSVRFGTIAVMPDESDGIYNGYLKKKLEAYLVETHTISGYSGSPVFLHVPRRGTRMMHPNDMPEMPSGTWLLGIEWGHLLTYEEVYKKDKNGNATIKTEYQARTTTGMMCVSPSWHLLDLLNDPALVAEREKLTMEKERGKKSAPTTALDSALKPNVAGGDAILRAALNTPPQPKLKRKAKASRSRVSSK